MQLRFLALCAAALFSAAAAAQFAPPPIASGAPIGAPAGNAATAGSVVAPNGLPRDYQEFKARYQTEGATPEGALRMHMQAVFAYLNPATRAEAGKMLRYSMHWSTPIEQSHNHATFVERLKRKEYHHIFRSYCRGTSPENSYQAQPQNCQLNAGRPYESDGFIKIPLQSSGADSARPIWLLEHDGLWYVENNTGLYVMVREPQSHKDARRNAHDADYD